MKSGETGIREEGKFAQAFEIVYHHPIVKEKFWQSFWSGLIGGQYKYTSAEPLTLNKPESLNDKVTSDWDTNLYNWSEFFFAFVVRVPKNIFKFVTEFALVGAHVNLKRDSFFGYVTLALARVVQTFTSPITAVWETSESTLEKIKDRSNPKHSWVAVMPGMLGTLLHVLLATCVATAYLIITSTILFSLLNDMGLGSVVVGSVNFANYLGSGQIGSHFVNLIATGGAFVGLNFDTSGLLPAISLASSLLTVIVPVAVVRWWLRQNLDISLFTKLANWFRRKEVPVVQTEKSIADKSTLTSTPSTPEHASAEDTGEHKPPIDSRVLGPYEIIPVSKIDDDKPITIDPSTPKPFKLLVGKGNVEPWNQGNIDPRILSIDGQEFTLRFTLNSSKSSTLKAGSALAASGQPKELFSCETIPAPTGSQSLPIVISDNSPIKVGFQPGSSSDTTDLTLGEGHTLQLSARFSQISAALSSPSKVLAAAAADTGNDTPTAPVAEQKTSAAPSKRAGQQKASTTGKSKASFDGVRTRDTSMGARLLNRS